MSLTSAASAASAVSRLTPTVDARERAHRRNRGTILVASTNLAWASVVGEMVADSGFTPAYPAERETPWLSVTRTRPCIAICDCDVPMERIQRFVLEAWARHVPVLVSATGRSSTAQSLKPRRVARFRFPVSPEAFRSMLERLLPSVTQSPPACEGERGDSRHSAGVRRHCVPTARRDRLWPGFRESARIGHSDDAANARADDDGPCPFQWAREELNLRPHA